MRKCNSINAVTDVENDASRGFYNTDIPKLPVGSLIFGQYLVLKQINEERIYLVSDIQSDNIFALKISNREKIFTEQFNLRREYICHAEFNSPHIVKLYDALEDNTFFAFIMEFIGGGDLIHYKENSKYAKFDLAIKVLKGVSAALQEIHEKNYIHGDIKPENILVGSNGIIKLTDFGISRNLKFETRNDEETRGTLRYLCPHYLTTGRLQPANDVFSLGLVVYEIILGTIPFDHQDIMITLKNRVYEDSPLLTKCVKDCPTDLAYIVDRCLRLNLDERYSTATEILKDLESYKTKLVHIQPKSRICLFDDLSKISRKSKNRTTTLHGTEAA